MCAAERKVLAGLLDRIGDNLVKARSRELVDG
jgi:hypothetical protein